MADRAVDFAGDPKLGQDRHPVHRVFEPGHDAVIVRLKEFVLSLPRALVFPHRVRIGLFVDADQALLLLHADIAGHQPVIAHDRQFLVEGPELRHRVGDEVVVRHRGRRKVVSGPERDLPRIGAAGVDNMFAGDVALLGLHQPFAALGLRHVRRPAAADHLHAQLPRPLGERKGRARRVDVTVIGRVQRRLHPVEVVERVQLADALGPHDLHRKAKTLADRYRLVKPVEFVIGIGQPQRAAAMPGDRLPGLGLKHPGIKVDVVAHAFAKPVAGGGVGDLTRRMPCGARGQFRLFQKNDVRPPLMCEVIGKAAAHDSTTDDDDAGSGGNH